MTSPPQCAEQIPATFGWDLRIIALLILIAAIIVSILLAFVTYALGDLVARLTVGPATRITITPLPRKEHP